MEPTQLPPDGDLFRERPSISGADSPTVNARANTKPDAPQDAHGQSGPGPYLIAGGATDSAGTAQWRLFWRRVRTLAAQLDVAQAGVGVEKDTSAQGQGPDT